MENEKKLTGDERRLVLLEKLKTAGQPITGAELGQLTNVSRQVIVGDMNLLKARNEPIIATNQGYLYTEQKEHAAERIIVCRHAPERTEEELNILVDHGVTVKDVRVAHSVYGDVRASIMVSNRREVRAFIEKIQQANAPYLFNLDDSGVHLHTISADQEEQLDEAVAELKKAGFLVD